MPDDIGTISDPEQHDFPTFEGDVATANGPEASSYAPPSEGTTLVGDQSQGAKGKAEFDERYREDFEGLLFLGQLKDEFVWAGHRFVIRTLTTGDYLEVGLVQKRYRDTIGDSRAYVAALVSASIVSVDGRSLPSPISTAPDDTVLHNQFRYILDHWYPWTVDAVYNRIVALEARVEEVLREMGEAGGQTG